MPCTYHSLGFDLCRWMRWCCNLCTRGKHTQPFSDGIQHCSVALSQPIWLHLQSSWSHTRTLYLAVFVFIGQPWFMTIKVQHNWLTLHVFYKSCSRGKALAAKKKKCWKMSENRRNAWRDALRRSSRVSAAEVPLVYFYNRRLLAQLCMAVPSTCVHSNGQVM